ALAIAFLICDQRELGEAERLHAWRRARGPGGPVLKRLACVGVLAREMVCHAKKQRAEPAPRAALALELVGARGVLCHPLEPVAPGCGRRDGGAGLGGVPVSAPRALLKSAERDGGRVSCAAEIAAGEVGVGGAQRQRSGAA